METEEQKKRGRPGNEANVVQEEPHAGKSGCMVRLCHTHCLHTSYTSHTSRSAWHHHRRSAEQGWQVLPSVQPLHCSCVGTLQLMCVCARLCTSEQITEGILFPARPFPPPVLASFPGSRSQEQEPGNEATPVHEGTIFPPLLNTNPLQHIVH